MNHRPQVALNNICKTILTNLLVIAKHIIRKTLYTLMYNNTLTRNLKQKVQTRKSSATICLMEWSIITTRTPMTKLPNNLICNCIMEKYLVKKVLAEKALTKNTLVKKALAKNTLVKKALAKDALAKDALAEKALKKKDLLEKALAEKALAKDRLVKDGLAEKVLA